VEISCFGHKEWLGIHAIFSKGGVEEMMRSASCFILLFHGNNYLCFPKEASKSNPLLV